MRVQGGCYHHVPVAVLSLAALSTLRAPVYPNMDPLGTTDQRVDRRSRMAVASCFFNEEPTPITPSLPARAPSNLVAETLGRPGLLCRGWCWAMRGTQLLTKQFSDKCPWSMPSGFRPKDSTLVGEGCHIGAKASVSFHPSFFFSFPLKQGVVAELWVLIHCASPVLVLVLAAQGADSL